MCNFSGFHGGVFGESNLVGYDAMLVDYSAQCRIPKDMDFFLT